MRRSKGAEPVLDLMIGVDRQPSDIGLDELATNVRAYGCFAGYLGCSKMQVCREPPGGGRDGNPHKGRKYGSDIDDRGST